jgi:A/G-specific adenine glycosylase
MAALREADGPLSHLQMEAAWRDGTQRSRCLAGLVADGLVEPTPDGFALPGLAHHWPGGR